MILQNHPRILAVKLRSLAQSLPILWRKFATCASSFSTSLQLVYSIKRARREIDFVEAPHTQHNSSKLGSAFA